ncbi:mariner transposase [Trichonephila clavipes]|nr:mariner transposase [Trichonephila clavipes]
MMDRISIREPLAKRNEIDPFLKRIVTGDEKWVTYENIVRKRSWSKLSEEAQTVAKPGLTSRKALLCIWWDWKGIIYYELLSGTVYSDACLETVYRRALDYSKNWQWMTKGHVSAKRSKPAPHYRKAFSRLTPLTTNHRRLRLQWAHEHRAWQANWHQAVFSDESPFNSGTTMAAFVLDAMPVNATFQSTLSNDIVAYQPKLWFGM